MKRHLFWLVTGLFAAIAAHAAFALFVPAWWFSRGVDQLAAAHGANSFFILPGEDQSRLLPGLPRAGVTGLCVFDVSEGQVTLEASLPEGFWITTIYSGRAQPIYSVNNRQSGADSFSVSLSRAPGLIEQVIRAADGERPEIDNGWTVNTPTDKGLAVVWYPVAEPGMRALVADALSRSRCTAQARPSGS